MARTATERPRPGAAGHPAPARPAPAAPETADGRGGVRPWHLLLLATLAAVAAGVVVTRGTPPLNTVAVAITIASAALVAAATARTVVPLAAPESGEQTEMIGGRTRAAFEREKMLVLRSIKELEFDRAMKKISDADFEEMSTRLRSRAAAIMRQLDGEGLGYRAIIERDLATRVGAPAAAVSPAGAEAPAAGARACGACGAEADTDARFCKSCGSRIEGAE